MDEKEIESPLKEKKKQTNGEWLVKNLKPLGCFLVLAMAALALVICFTAGRDPIRGYEPAQTSEYYAQHPDELKSELEQKVFPALEGVTRCEEKDGKLEIRIAYDRFVVVRSAILRYFDGELFVFRQEGAQG